jgi:hypothetical protein
MKIVRTLAGNPVCNNAWDCPRICETDEGSLVVQGYTVTDPATLAALALDPGESAVLITAAVADEARVAGLDLRWAQQTADGSYLVRGITVSDPDVLTDLHMPRGESAVIPTLTPQEALL